MTLPKKQSPAIIVRNIPDELRDGLKKLAVEQKRSMNTIIIELIRYYVTGSVK